MQGVRAVFANAPAGLLLQRSGIRNDEQQCFQSQVGNLRTARGLAWDVEGNGRTSVRASYSLNYLDFPTQLRQGEAVNQPPWGNLTALTSPAGGLDDPWRDYPGGNPFPTTLTRNVPFVLFGQYLSQPFDVQPTYTQSWNLSVQREVVPGTLVSDYLGSARHICGQSSRSTMPSLFPSRIRRQLLPERLRRELGGVFNSKYPDPPKAGPDQPDRWPVLWPHGYMDDGRQQMYGSMLFSVQSKR